MTVKIRVRDFQSIEDAEIEVSGLTVITGQNNLGKSAFYRAAHGVFTNARGTKYVRHGKDQCRVDVTFSDGRTITWEKGEKVNRYTVDGKTLDKVGSGVPAEVEALGVVPITAAGRELWPQFAPQFTGQVFLLDQPGSVLAESVADVARVGVLNEALRNAQSDKRALASELKVRLSDVVRYESQEAHYAGLDNVDSLAQEAEALNVLVDDLLRQLDGARSLHDAHVSLSLTVSALRPVRDVVVPDGVGDVRSDLNLLDEVRDLQTKLGGVATFLELLSPVAGIVVPDDADTARVHKVSDAIALLTDLRDRMEPFAVVAEGGGTLRSVVSAPLPDTGHAVKELLGLDDHRSFREALVSRTKALSDYASDLQNTTEEYEVAVHDVISLIGTAGECPTCGVQHTHDG